MELAHQTWFTEQRPPYRLDFLLEPATLALVAGAVVVAVVWRLVSLRLPQPEIGALAPVGRLAPWIPRLLGIHLGVSLVAQAYGRTFLAPSLELAPTLSGTVLAIAEGVVGVWLVSGWKLRPAAWAVVAAGPLGMVAYGVVPILERVELLGVAVFLALIPPGPDRHGAVDVTPDRVRIAGFWMRLLSGGALVVLAFTEKLLRPDLALALIDRFPFLNVLRLVGFEVSDLDFVRFAGAVELLFGLLVISGALPQVTVLVAGVPFNATLFFFGASELVGHLPLYGVMLALLVYGSSTRFAGTVPWLPGRDRAAGSRARAGEVSART